MRILFLCSSLECGRDGVGDYVRVLADECRRQGHVCSLAAVYDRSVTQVQRMHDAELRLPSVYSWEARAQAAKDFCHAFKPDVISLQFVPYGFQDRGIVWPLPRFLRAVIGAVPLHVMFHELWIGSNLGASLWHRMVGFWQRAAIRHMLRAVPPFAVTTSVEVYRSMLAREGVSATVLPLFGNIAISFETDIDWLYERCTAAGVEVTPETRDQWWVVGFFATLHPQWSPEPFLTEQIHAAAAWQKSLVLATIGRQGTGGTLLWTRLAAEYGDVVAFVDLGEQPPERVSSFLQWVDAGVATSPRALLGKSGSAAAMREHGLPVIANRDDWQRRGAPVEEFGSDEAPWQKVLVSREARRKPAAMLPAITQQFLAVLRREVD